MHYLLMLLIHFQTLRSHHVYLGGDRQSSLLEKWTLKSTIRKSSQEWLLKNVMEALQHLANWVLLGPEVKRAPFTDDALWSAGDAGLLNWLRVLGF